MSLSYNETLHIILFYDYSGSYGTSSPSMPLVRQSRLGSRSSAYSAAISMGSHGTIPGYSFGQTAERIEPRQNFEEINCYLDSMDPRSELLFMRNSRSYHSMPKGQYLSINGVRNSAPCLLPDYIERYGNFGSEEPYGQSVTMHISIIIVTMSVKKLLRTLASLIICVVTSLRGLYLSTIALVHSM